MSKPTLEESLRAEREKLFDERETLMTQAAVKWDQIELLDRLLASAIPAGPKPAAKSPGRPRKVPVAAHVRTIGEVETHGPALGLVPPGDEGGEAKAA